MRRCVWILCLTAGCGLLAPEPDDTDPPTTEGPPPPDTAETGLVRLGYVGTATIDSGFAGEETFTATRVRDAATLCTFRWRTVDWARDDNADGPDPITLPCVDPAGTACSFAYTVNLVEGRVPEDVEEDRCAAFREVATLLPRVGPLGYGFVDAYAEVPGGPTYGPALMFYVGAEPPEQPYWVGYGLQATFDGITLDYAFDLGTLPY